LARLIAHRIAEFGESALLFDESSRPADPGLQRLSHIITSEDEVYHLLPPGTSVEAVERALTAAETGIALVGVTCERSALLPDLPSGTRVSPAGITACARSAHMLFVGIFDGESYLVCDLPSPDAP